MTKKNDAKFKSKGVGVKHETKPVSVMLPPDVEEIVRSLPDRSNWLRKAIRNQLIVDGLLEEIEEQTIAC